MKDKFFTYAERIDLYAKPRVSAPLMKADSAATTRTQPAKTWQDSGGMVGTWPNEGKSKRERSPFEE